ncbi:MAG: hypothetical protein NTX91_04195, partial [candidate division SR1 bacterium]|nr:hypothetical protein [candidate division SR1 bacterium]
MAKPKTPIKGNNSLADKQNDSSQKVDIGDVVLETNKSPETINFHGNANELTNVLLDEDTLLKDGEISDFTKEGALVLIEKDVDTFMRNVDKYDTLDEEVANKLVEKRLSTFVLYHLDKIKVSKKFIEGIDLDTMRGINDPKVLVDIYKHKELTVKEMADDLFDRRHADYVAQNIDTIFLGLDPQVFVDKVIAGSFGNMHAGVQDLEKFKGIKGIDRQKVGKKLLNLVERAQITPRFAADHIDNLPGLDPLKVAALLKQTGEGEEDPRIAHKIYTLQGLNDQQIFLNLLNDGRKNYAALSLGGFKGLDKEVAMNLIKKGRTIVSNHLYVFQGLDKEVAMLLIGTSPED